MSRSEAGPLSALIGRHRAGRTDAELAEASLGVPSASQWKELEQRGWRWQDPLDPVIIGGIAVALGLTEDTVRHYAIASRGLPALGLMH